MVSRRVMLVGAMVAGVSYVLAITRPSPEAAAPATDESAVAAPPRDLPLSHAADDRRDISALGADLARMKNELATLRDERQSQHAEAESAPPAPKSDEQLQAEHDEYMAGVERAFEQEPRDARWAQDTTQSLRDALQAEPIMLAALHGLECRSTACRLELRDDGSTAFAEELPLTMHHMGAVLPEVRFSHAELSDGARLHVMYMSQPSAASAAER